MEESGRWSLTVWIHRQARPWPQVCISMRQSDQGIPACSAPVPRLGLKLACGEARGPDCVYSHLAPRSPGQDFCKPPCKSLTTRAVAALRVSLPVHQLQQLSQKPPSSPPRQAFGWHRAWQSVPWQCKLPSACGPAGSTEQHRRGVCWYWSLGCCLLLPTPWTTPLSGITSE